MPRLLAVLVAALTFAAVPVSEFGRASLEFHFLEGDTRSRASLQGEGEGTASARVVPSARGGSTLSVQLQIEEAEGGTRHLASVKATAEIPDGGLRIGEVTGDPRHSHATFETRSVVVQTQDRIRPTDVRLRVERIDEGAIHGAIWMESDRESTVRVTGSFVAPLAPEM